MSNTLGFGLGSNLGCREKHLALAREALQWMTPMNELRLSPLYESSALLPENAEEGWDKPFLNQVMTAVVDTLPDPQALLLQVKEVEEMLGRRARGHWAPREIDIDLLFVGDTVIESPSLTLPHAQMHLRHFVMLPLTDVAPEWVHPVIGKTARELASALPREGIAVYEH